MRNLKMLGLVVLATLALTAVVGAGAASAKVCSLSGGGAACGTGHGSEYKANVTAKASGVELRTGTVNLTCGESQIANLITNSFTGAGSMGELSFAKCVNGLGNGCTASSNGRPYTTTIAGGTLTFSPTFSFTCLAPAISCEYSVANATPIVTNSGTAPRILASEVKMNKVAGAGCEPKLTWIGEYLVSVPTSLWQT